MHDMRDKVQASADLAASAANTPWGGQQLLAQGHRLPRLRCRLPCLTRRHLRPVQKQVVTRTNHYWRAGSIYFRFYHAVQLGGYSLP